MTEDDIQVGQELIKRMVVLMKKQAKIAKQMQSVIVEMQDYITRAVAGSPPVKPDETIDNL